MTHSVSNLHEAQTVIVGVDTHKHMHVAVAIDSRGIRLGAHSFGADSEGYRALLTWAEAYGGIEAVGIEGTGGYGVGLSRTVHRAGHRVVEVNRVDRRLRRATGKSDTIDAEAAARAVPHPGNTRSGHWPVAGSPSPTKSRRMTYTSPDSPPRRRPPSGRASPLAPTPPPRC